VRLRPHLFRIDWSIPVVARYLTERSEWLVDSSRKLYRRVPLDRETAEPPDSHRTLFDTWLPYESVKIVDSRWGPMLHVMAPDSVEGVLSSPIVAVG